MSDQRSDITFRKLTKSDTQTIKELYSQWHQTTKKLDAGIILKHIFDPDAQVYMINENQGFVYLYDTNEFGYYMDSNSRGQGFAQKAFDFIKANHHRPYYFGTVRNENSAALIAALKNGFQVKGLVLGYDNY